MSNIGCAVSLSPIGTARIVDETTPRCVKCKKFCKVSSNKSACCNASLLSTMNCKGWEIIGFATSDVDEHGCMDVMMNGYAYYNPKFGDTFCEPGQLCKFSS